MMVQWKQGMHWFVSKWQAKIGDSLCENYNSIIHPSRVRKLKQVTILDIIILSTNINAHWKDFSYLYMMMVQWTKGLVYSFLKNWQVLIWCSLSHKISFSWRYAQTHMGCCSLNVLVFARPLPKSPTLTI
jgi:hypothetical protein